MTVSASPLARVNDRNANFKSLMKLTGLLSRRTQLTNSKNVELLPEISPDHDKQSISIPDNPTIFKSDDPIAVCGIGFGVRNLNDGGPFVIQSLEQIHDLFALR